MQAYIKVVDVEKYHGSSGSITKAIDRVSFEIEKGGFIAIMGGSGSGKTTLLNMIATIDTVTAGYIYFEGEDITKMNEEERSGFRKGDLGFIFQDLDLLDIMTLEENIYLPSILKKEGSDHIVKRAREIMDILGIRQVGDKYPYQVSVGQRRRCSCARALVNDPKLILADEPTDALDVQNSENLMGSLLEINDRFKTTILMVTHDPFAASYCDRVLFLEKGKISYELYRGVRKREENLQAILDAQKSIRSCRSTGGWIPSR